MLIWCLSIDTLLLTCCWWTWINYAPLHPRPTPVIESSVDLIIAKIRAALREPGCTFNVYIFMCLMVTVLSWTFVYLISRIFARFSPIHFSAWVDWLLPPTTITHTVQSKDGKVKRNARDFRDIFTTDSFMLERAYLAEDNPHKYAARRRLAAVNMVQALSKKLGLPIYDEQMSRRGARRGFSGSRTLMDAEDACSYTAENLRYERIKSGSIVTHIDTFTHKDLYDANTTLSDGNIHYLYTWNPDSVAGTSDEILFRYDEDGTFVTTVEGSASYFDRLWNFECDSLVTYSYELRVSMITVISVLAALTIFCYNIYTDREYNQTLTNVGLFYVKSYELRMHHPIPTVYAYTNHDGYIANMTHAVRGYGMPSSLLENIEGYRIPCVAWNYTSFHYYWPAEPYSLTKGHWLFITASFSLALLGTFTPIAISHKVVRLDVGEQRSIVVIIPNCKFRGFAAFARPFLSGRSLKPRVPIVGETDGGHKFLAERRKKPAGYSVAFTDSHHAHFIKDAVNDMTKCLTTDKGSPSLSNVRVSTKYEGDEAHRVAVALSIAITKVGDKIESYSSNYGFYPMPLVIRQDDEFKADAKEIKLIMAHGAMPAIVTGAAFIHAKSEAQCRDFVRRRLTGPAGKVDSKFTPEIVMYIAEFAKHILRNVTRNEIGHLEPIGEQEYIDSRSKSQLNKFHDIVAIYDIHNFDDRQGFMKREVLPDPTKPARAICCFPPETQALGGRIALAYAAAMKANPWMACGLNPAETTEAVIRVSSGATSVTDTDFSAQDATIDLNKRGVELMLLLQLFDERWHGLIREWHWTDYCGRVLYGDKGTKREPHDFNGSRGSGSPFTTLGNTPLTGLFAYIALRLSDKEPNEAWSCLGIYSGDDGITADLPPASCDQAAEALGFLIKSDTNDRYIPFLGRHYFDPICGSPSSIQSPLRTLSKLHTTLLNIDEFTAEETIIMKAICLQVTDRHSDFFGPWSEKILRDAHENSIQDLRAKILRYPGLHPYFAITALRTETTFQNNTGDFEELFEIQMPGFDWSKFNAWLVDGKGPCPLLWSHPEVDDAAMEDVGPVTLAMGGLDDQANMVEYELTPPKKCVTEDKVPPVKKKRRQGRSREEHKELLGTIQAAGLLEEYRAAKYVPTDPPDVRDEKRRTRDKIVSKVSKTPVHKPRSI